jgi:isoamylase
MYKTIGHFITLFFIGCASENYPRLYHSEQKASSLTWETIENLDHLGPTIIDRGVNFSLYSENATRLELLLFDDPNSNLPTQQFEMHRINDELWNIYVEGIGEGQHYGFIAWGPNWEYQESWLPGKIDGFIADVDFNGNRFNPNKLLFDPYGLAIHRDHDWLKGSTASGPKRNDITYGAASKSVIVTSEYEWTDTENNWRELRQKENHPNHNWNELIMYEVHPKGLTKNPASGVEHPGTYRGIGEIAPYLQDLGVNALELLPIHEKPLDGGYWGYNNLSFFAPENEFSADYLATGRVDSVLDEFKWMVDQLHQHDIEVIVDVVYNHTGEGGLWREKLFFEFHGSDYDVNFDPVEVAGLYSYRGIDNAAYYALSPDGQEYWNNTGVGNQTRPNHTPMRRLIMDSLHFYVEELHVDGFRFDLAGILGEPDLDYNAPSVPSETVLQDIIDDPILQQYNTRIISEPWTAAGSGPGIGGFPVSTTKEGYAWAEWNAHFRDWWRSFINNCNWVNGENTCIADAPETPLFVLNSTEGVDGGSVMTGSADIYGWNGRSPYHSINFVTVHDGFTLYDLFSYGERQNECGLLNPICCDDPYSAWCDTESGESHNRSYDWGMSREHMKRQQMRNLFSAMFFSHGTPLILGGDEWMRTQYGNNNSYSTWADNEWNWFRWGEWQSTSNNHRSRMHDFVRKLTRLRKDRLYAFSPSEYNGGMPFSWKDENNNDANWSSRVLMIHYYNDGNWDDPELVVLINMSPNHLDFTLPTGRSWSRILDTQSYYDTDGTGDEPSGYFNENTDLNKRGSYNISLETPVDITGSTYGLPGFSIAILEEK